MYVVGELHVFIMVLITLWSSGQSSWLQIQKSGFDSQHYQIFSEVEGLERGPLSLVSTIEKLLGRKSSGSGLEIRGYGCWDPQKLAPTSLTSGRLPWAHATDFVFLLFIYYGLFYEALNMLYYRLCQPMYSTYSIPDEVPGFFN
jgi:hypothetical protein